MALRLINDAAALVDPGTTAIPELVEAVRQGVVSVRDARLVIGETAAVQQLGLSLKAIGQVRSLKKGVERARLEIAERRRHKQDRPEHLTITSGRTTLHQLDLPGLRDWVAPATVDVIIAVPPDDPSPSWFSYLVDLTVHALTEEGVLLVPAGVELMKEAITRLEHKALRWVCNIALQFPAAVCRLGEPHRLEITQLPLLVYGKPGYRLGGGSGRDCSAAPGRAMGQLASRAGGRYGTRSEPFRHYGSGGAQPHVQRPEWHRAGRPEDRLHLYWCRR